MGQKAQVGALAICVIGAGFIVLGPVSHPYIGTALISAGAILFLYNFFRRTRKSTVGEIKSGNHGTFVGDVSGTFGDGCTVVGPTDSNGNTILNQAPLAIGAGAKAGPGSISIGYNAGASADKKPE